MKQDVVREELEKRSRLLEIHRQQQLDELDLIQKSKTELTNTAHRLAEKYEDAKEAQERFVERWESIIEIIQVMQTKESETSSITSFHSHIYKKKIPKSQQVSNAMF